ncbi:MAG: P1 family peptidase, partial [Spirochaetales bacterium]|nr:P1 family peptidase [Candidatus Physcosoma equi]
MKEIRIQEVGNVRIGQAEDKTAGTGVTVIISDSGMGAGLDVRGGGPASRESQVLNPLMAAEVIHAVVLGGGSAFGLDAAGGVMQYLEEHDIGFDVGVTKVPLVSQADIFDLAVGDSTVRPDKAMGYSAAKNSENGGNYQDGCYGAGTGATVGKARLGESAMKSGIGSYAVELGDLRVGAIVVVNALGDVYDETGKEVAGLIKLDRSGLESSEDVLLSR